MRTSSVSLPLPDGTKLALGIDAGGRWAPPQPGAPQVDVGDGVALPGLVDAHAHLTSADSSHMNGSFDDTVRERVTAHAKAQLDAGVLLLADKGTHLASSVGVTLGLPEETRPAVQLAGRFLAGEGGYYPGYAVEVEPENLTGAMPGVTPDGAGWVKVIGDWPRRGVGAVPNFDESALRSLADAARSAGLRTAIHTAAPETPGMAVRAGIDSIEHGLFLTEDDLGMLGHRGGAWVPTVAAMEILAEQLGWDSSGGRLLREGLENVRNLLPMARSAGVYVMAGTDLALAHGEVVLEAERLVAYGMPEADVVEVLTMGSRGYLGEPGFEVGGPADFIMVNAPDSVAALSTPSLIVRCGTIVVDRRG